MWDGGHAAFAAFGSCLSGSSPSSRPRESGSSCCTVTCSICRSCVIVVRYFASRSSSFGSASGPISGVAATPPQPSTRVRSVCENGPTLPLASAHRAQYTTSIGTGGTGGLTRIGLVVNDRKYHGKKRGQRGTGQRGTDGERWD